MNPDKSGIIGEAILHLTTLINAGAATRLIIIILHAVHSEDDKASYKAKAKNLLIFVVIANAISGLMTTLLSYIL